MNHQSLMQRCIDLGQKVLGKTYPNPNVGSLLFYDGKIISEGYTSKYGHHWTLPVWTDRAIVGIEVHTVGGSGGLGGRAPAPKLGR